jgi:2-oxoglutarate ferredoxin oxidoreductase subunit alpha
VMIPEMNLGQLSLLIRAKYLVDVVGYNQVNGMPLKAAELAEAITDLIAHTVGDTVSTTTLGTTDSTGEMEAVK